MATELALQERAVTTALVGMQQVRHVDDNLALARVAPVSHTQFVKLFREAPLAQQ